MAGLIKNGVQPAMGAGVTSARTTLISAHRRGIETLECSTHYRRRTHSFRTVGGGSAMALWASPRVRRTTDKVWNTFAKTCVR